MSQPTFSIVIPTYNVAPKLAATLESVTVQTGASYEVLVMDGASTDETRAVMENYGDRDDVYFHSEPDAGVYDAMNKGIARARGDWLYFLGAGDTLRAGVLEQIARHLAARPPRARLIHGDLVYGDMWLTLENRAYDGPFTASKLRTQNIGHQAIFYERGVFALMGGYDGQYVAFADHVFNIRCWGEPRVRKLYLPIVVADFEGGGLSALADPDAAYLRDRLRLIRRHLGWKQWALALFARALPADFKHWLRARARRAAS